MIAQHWLQYLFNYVLCTMKASFIAVKGDYYDECKNRNLSFFLN